MAQAPCYTSLEMITHDSQLEPLDLVYVQEEPALEIALPQVFDQPLLTTLRRGKLADPEGLAMKIAQQHLANPEAGLGPDHQELVTEFAPLFTWTTACWDYLLSTEGVRFLPRRGEQKLYVRGDYRAFTDRDYSRLTHSVFRGCVLEFGQAPVVDVSLSQWVRQRFWPRVLEGYRQLEQPADPRQRVLTPYSYLRCVPYQFLSEFHHDLVYHTIQRLPGDLQRVIEVYFLHFFTADASAQALGCSLEECEARLRQALTHLLIQERLVYCLLRQLERY